MTGIRGKEGPVQKLSTWRRSLPLLGAAVVASCGSDCVARQGAPPAAALAEEAFPPAPAEPAKALSPAAAAAGPAEIAPEAAEPAGGVCNFDVHEYPIDRVLDYVRRASGLAISVSPELLDERITLKVRNFPWRALLDHLALWLTDSFVEESPEGPRLIRGTPEALMERWWRLNWPPPGMSWRAPWRATASGTGTVTFDCQDRPIDPALESIRRVAEVNIIVAPEMMEERVTMKATRLPWQEALQVLVEGVGGVVIEYGPDFLRVQKWPPGPVDPLSALLRECRERGEAFRRAEAARDIPRMASAQRAFRWRAALLERGIREIPEAYRTRDSLARWPAEVEEPRARLLREFGDLLEGK